MELSSEFLNEIVTDKTIAFSLPDGRKLAAAGLRVDQDDKGVIRVWGKVTSPEPGTLFLQRQDFTGVAGSMVGHVLFDQSDIAWKVVPEGHNGASILKEVSADAVVCRRMALPQEMPQDHPGSLTVPNPPYQAVIPLQSLPGAAGVVYLDFDGEKGPFPGWWDSDAVPSGFSNDTIRDIWIRVAEDFLPFNLNVTTDRKVYDAAPQGQRIHCIISSSYNGGGVAYMGSFNWGGDPICWANSYTDDGAVTVISHEIGHTLGLYHDGFNGGEYYGGQGSGVSSWAPIMGVGYGRNIKQWSKGDYNLATNSWQDDLWTISTQNNGVAYRADDVGETLESAAYLNIAAGGNVVNQQGIIGTTGEVDAYRFKTNGGTINFNLTTSYAPNLDIYAELVNAATGLMVASTNADDPEVNANLTTSVPAGEYLLKISGIGYASPSNNTGYSNYGSLGSYRIDGSVSGGESYQGFTIAENASNGTSIGTILPTSLSGTLSYTISAGNPGGAFAIHPSSGLVTVANSNMLNYETLSTRFDVPAAIELFVTISNQTGTSQTVRALVSVNDVNELPVISPLADTTLIENTSAGLVFGQASASDVDRYDYPVFSIVSGNAAGFFRIDSGTGQISLANSPSVSSDSLYNLVIQATDTRGASSTATMNVTIRNLPAGFTANPGGLYRTFFNNISGTAVSDLTSNAAFPDRPDQEIFLTSFDGGTYGDNFGSTIRGYLIPPTTGAYTFYTASDDASQLILGSGTAQVSSPVIASIAGWTNPYDWDAVPSGTSSTINLVAGQPYYIEMRQKEGGGGDHLALAWSGPGISRQVIPGRYLAPFYQNYAPRPTGNLSVPELAAAGTAIGKLPVVEVNTQDSLSNYTIIAGNNAGLFAVDANTGIVTLAQAGQFNLTTNSFYDLTFSVTDNGIPSRSGTGVVRITILPDKLYFDPNSSLAGSVSNGASYAWLSNNWAVAPGGTVVSGNWIAGSKAVFAATSPASPLSYDVNIAGYNSGYHGDFGGIEARSGTVNFTGAVDNFYLINPITVRAATGSAIRFNHTCSEPSQGFNLNGKTVSFEGDISFNNCGIGNGVGNSGNVIVNSGVLTLNSSGTYTGITEIKGGMLVAANNNALGAGGHDGNTMSFIYDGATLALQGDITSNEHFHLWGAGENGLGALRNLSGNNSLTDSYTLRANSTIGVDQGSLTVPYFYESGGSFSLTKSGSGMLILTGGNSYTGGTNVNGGVLELRNTAWILGNVGGAGVTVSSNAILRANNSLANQLNGLALNHGTVESTNSLGNADWGDFYLSGNVTATGVSSMNADIALRASNINFDVAAGGTLNIAGNLHNGAYFGIYSGAPANLSKSGSGTMVFSQNHSYTGSTSVNQGVLTVTGGILSTSSITIATGAELRCSGRLQTSGNVINSGTLVFSGSAIFAAGGSITNYGTIINSSPSLVLPANIINLGSIVTLPTSPTGLTATANGSSAVLSWSAVAGATSYRVKQSTSVNGPFAVVGSPTSNSFTVNALAAGTYSFVVSAVNAAGESTNSSVASCTVGTLPAPWVTADIGTVG
ncbi:MAG: hypothetical protein EAZ81_09605, partial [Verrucomicrobia bacterium]